METIYKKFYKKNKKNENNYFFLSIEEEENYGNEVTVTLTECIFFEEDSYGNLLERGDLDNWSNKAIICSPITPAEIEKFQQINSIEELEKLVKELYGTDIYDYDPIGYL